MATVTHEQLLDAYAADKRWRAADAKLTRAAEACRKLPRRTAHGRVATAKSAMKLAAEERARVENEIRQRLETRKRGA